MSDTSSILWNDVKNRLRRPEDTAFLLPDGTFLGASETDIIAIEREMRPDTTTRRRAGGPPPA